MSTNALQKPDRFKPGQRVIVARPVAESSIACRNRMATVIEARQHHFTPAGWVYGYCIELDSMPGVAVCAEESELDRVAHLVAPACELETLAG